MKNLAFKNQNRLALSEAAKCAPCMHAAGFGIKRIGKAIGTSPWVARNAIIRSGAKIESKRSQAAAKRLGLYLRRGAPQPEKAAANAQLVDDLQLLRAVISDIRADLKRRPEYIEAANKLAREYYYANRSKIRKRENERMRTKRKDPAFANRVREALKQWKKENPNKAREYLKKAKSRDPERFRAYRKKYNKNPYMRIVINLRRRLREIVKRKGGTVTSVLTGCNANTLKLHLQSQFRRGMDWSNYGTKWVVDHIVPCARFDLSIEGQQKACFHFSNLQPLFAQENADKSDRIVPCQPELVIAL